MRTRCDLCREDASELIEGYELCSLHAIDIKKRLANLNEAQEQRRNIHNVNAVDEAWERNR